MLYFFPSPVLNDSEGLYKNTSLKPVGILGVLGSYTKINRTFGSSWEPSIALRAGIATNTERLHPQQHPD